MGEIILGVVGKMGWVWILLIVVWLLGFHLTKLVATQSSKITQNKNKKQKEKTK